MRRPISIELLGLGAGAAALIAAHGIEAMGIVPCALCYVERWPYRVAVIAAVASMIWTRGQRLLRPLLMASFVAAMCVAFVHVGVEAAWWKSPLPECAAPKLNTRSVAALLQSMPARPNKPCDSPTYLIPGIPVSIALLNLAYAGVVLISLSALTQRQRVRG